MSVDYNAISHPAGVVRERSRRSVRPRELALRADRAWAQASLAWDLAFLALAVAAAAFASPPVKTFAGVVLWPWLFMATVLYLSYRQGSYGRRVRIDTLDRLRATASAVAVATGTVVTARVLAGDATPDAVQHSVKIGLFALGSLACGRAALDLVQSRARRQGKALVPTLIVGAGHIGRTTARRLLEHPELGLKPVGFLDKEPLEDDDPTGLPVLGASWDLDWVAAEHEIGQVIVTFSTAPSEVLLRLVNRCEERGIAVALVPRLFEKVTERLSIEHLGGLPLITSHPTDPRGWQFALKYVLDRVLSFCLLCLASPVLLVCALAVWLSLGRPILFRQVRVGRDGRPFEMLKFRSMRPDDGGQKALDLPEDTAPGGVGGGERVTHVGAFLRNTSLDELPQLINVLRGEMSLVGPRPERPEFVELFEPRVYRYFDRHRVKAGITGWAQVNGLRGRTSLSDRVEWDNYYIENASLWLDLKIVGRTILTCFQFAGQRR